MSGQTNEPVSETIRELRDLLAGAGSLPWSWQLHSLLPEIGFEDGDSVPWGGTVEEGQLIVAAVNALPGLLDEIERLRKERDEWKNRAHFEHVEGRYAESDARQSAEREIERLRAVKEAAEEVVALADEYPGMTKGYRMEHAITDARAALAALGETKP